MIKLIGSEEPQYLTQDGALYSVRPPETQFGYFYFGHMIPPMKPKNALLLGYGYGTVAELIRRIWGECKITGVDIEAHDYEYMEYAMKIIDAREFVDDCAGDIVTSKFDYIGIDLWEGKKACDFVFDEDFAMKLRKIATGKICLNIALDDIPKIKTYFENGFSFDRCVPIEGNSIQWWSVNV